MPNTGDRLRALREEVNLTQEELSKKIGIKRDRYAKYETGATPVPGHLIVMFADFFMVSAGYLLGQSDDPKPKQIEDPETLKEFKEVQKELKELSDRLNRVIEKQLTKNGK